MSSVFRQILISFLLILCSLGASALCDQLPTEKDIADKSAAAAKVFGDFMQKTLPLRLRYEYSGRLLSDEDARSLVGLARQAHAELEGIHQAQSAMKKRIEEYEGWDWEQLYGRTGLWRRLYSDMQKTALMMCRTDLYGAIGVDAGNRKAVLERIIAKCGSPESGLGRANAALLKARAFAIMSRTDEDYNGRAREILRSLSGPAEIGESVFYEARLLELQLAGSEDLNRVYALANSTKASACRDVFELNVAFALMEIVSTQSHDARLLKAVVEKWPQVRGVLSAFVLERLVDLDRAGKLDADSLKSREPLEISLAAAAIAENNAADHAGLMEKIISIDQYQTSLVMYVYARAKEASEPTTAIRYYIKAAMARAKEADGDLALSASEIAGRAARVAYRLYYEDSRFLDTARLALEYYHRTAGEQADEKMEYLYAQVLGESGNDAAARELLEKIALGGGRFAQEAGVDLIAARVKDAAGDAGERVRIALELERMIDSADAGGDLSAGAKVKAVGLYARLLLERADKGQAEKALKILEGMEEAKSDSLVLLGALALGKLKRYDEAVGLLGANVDEMTCAAAEQIYAVLTDVLEELDLRDSKLRDSRLFGAQCRRLVEFCAECADEQLKGYVQLLWTEIILLTGTGRKSRLAVAETMLGDLESSGLAGNIEWIRCRARLLTAQGEYVEAFQLWARVRVLNEGGDSSATQRPPAWWRAKYYELLCFLNVSDANGQKVAHAIEVLKGSFAEMPAPWGDKLDELRSIALQGR